MAKIEANLVGTVQDNLDRYASLEVNKNDPQDNASARSLEPLKQGIETAYRNDPEATMRNVAIAVENLDSLGPIDSARVVYSLMALLEACVKAQKQLRGAAYEQHAAELKLYVERLEKTLNDKLEAIDKKKSAAVTNAWVSIAISGTALVCAGLGARGSAAQAALKPGEELKVINHVFLALGTLGQVGATVAQPIASLTSIGMQIDAEKEVAIADQRIRTAGVAEANTRTYEATMQRYSEDISQTIAKVQQMIANYLASQKGS